jgi:hypothetical protein
MDYSAFNSYGDYEGKTWVNNVVDFASAPVRITLGGKYLAKDGDLKSYDVSLRIFCAFSLLFVPVTLIELLALGIKKLSSEESILGKLSQKTESIAQKKSSGKAKIKVWLVPQVLSQFPEEKQSLIISKLQEVAKTQSGYDVQFHNNKTDIPMSKFDVALVFRHVSEAKGIEHAKEEEYLKFIQKNFARNTILCFLFDTSQAAVYFSKQASLVPAIEQINASGQSGVKCKDKCFVLVLNDEGSSQQNELKIDTWDELMKLIVTASVKKKLFQTPEKC